MNFRFLAVIILPCLVLACSAQERRPNELNCSEPPFISDEVSRLPYLQSVSENGAIIAWGLEKGKRPAKVRISGDAGKVKVLDITDSVVPGAEGAEVFLQAAKVVGLEAGTVYCYEIVRSQTRLAGPWTFRSAAPIDAEEVEFFVLGDYGSLIGRQAAVRDRMLEHVDSVDFWVTTGDNAYPVGGWSDFHNYVFGMYGEILTRVPFFPATGNHDYMTDNAAPYLANFFLPEQALREEDQERYYSFGWGAAHFIILDTETPLKVAGRGSGKDMLDWLRADLEAADRPWKIAVFHRPPYSAAADRDPSADALEKIVPILEEYGVQVVLNGHHHFYERFHPIRGGIRDDERGITYLTTGGGGAVLNAVGEHELLAYTAEAYHFLKGKISPCRLSFTAIDDGGEELDSIELTGCR